MKFPVEMTQALAMLAVIIFGAIVHATMQLQVARTNKDPFTWIDFVILLVLASFAGWLFGTLASIYFVDERMINAITGIGAVLGVAGINAITNTFLEVGKEFLRTKLK